MCKPSMPTNTFNKLYIWTCDFAAHSFVAVEAQYTAAQTIYKAYKHSNKGMQCNKSTILHGL